MEGHQTRKCFSVGYDKILNYRKQQAIQAAIKSAADHGDEPSNEYDIYKAYLRPLPPIDIMPTTGPGLIQHLNDIADHSTTQTLTIAYGAENSTPRTISVSLQADIPQEFILGDLTPDTSHFYSINDGEKHTFHTARPAGSTFTFTIQADSHLDSNTSAEVYLQTLANQRADHPDFVIDMGDTFMTDKYKPYTDAAPQYLAQRYFLGQLADTAPFYRDWETDRKSVV